MREENGYGLFGRRAGERFGDVVAPELKAHGADGGGGDGVSDAGGFDIEGADGEVSRLGRRGDEGLKDVGGRVVFSA